MRQQIGNQINVHKNMNGVKGNIEGTLSGHLWG